MSENKIIWPTDFPSLLRPGDPGYESYLEDTMMHAEPGAVLRARDVQDIREALRYCHSEKIPVTFCGAQTSMTGASVTDEGLLISTAHLNKIKDIRTHDQKAYVSSETGVILSDLRKAVASEGWFYPPAPTSQDWAFLGGTVATNASGEDSYKYGNTRAYIEELKILKSDGSDEVIKRPPGKKMTDLPNKGGFDTRYQEDMDLLIGSEGILAFIHEVTLRLVPQPFDYFSVLVPFPDADTALDFVIECHTKPYREMRALEYMDEHASSLMKTHPTFPISLKSAVTLVYFKMEAEDGSHQQKLMEKICAQLEKKAGPLIISETILASSAKEKEEMRLWRHHIPVTVNETCRAYRSNGGGKVGSDWWVPVPRIKEALDETYQKARQAGITVLAFAHVGRGHPHVNYFCKTLTEKKLAEKLLIDACKKAVQLGGGVSGEHGIGKLHRDQLPIQWNQTEIEWMMKTKKKWDPFWLLGRGNILEPPSK